VVLHPEKSENWTLQIKYPQERDAGVYECQVNTEPKISMAFHLTVIGMSNTDAYANYIFDMLKCTFFHLHNTILGIPFIFM